MLQPLLKSMEFDYDDDDAGKDEAGEDDEENSSPLPRRVFEINL